MRMDRYYMPVNREEDDSIDHQYKVTFSTDFFMYSSYIVINSLKML